MLVLPFWHLALKAKKQGSRERYPDLLRTWGECIKVRRLDSKLTKRQVSLKFHLDFQYIVGFSD